ncbi:MAG: hypothetical protein QOK34_240, partial [Gaiellaceae bacterium]|nr:hypothetical protein [Gaiellaceae bacterium]
MPIGVVAGVSIVSGWLVAESVGPKAAFL